MGERYTCRGRAVADPGAKILLLDENGITEVAYEETEHYSVTRSFLGNYKKMLRHLLEED